MPYLLVLAKLDAERKRSFSAVAAVTHLDLAVSEKVESSLAWLESHEPRVVVFDTAVVQAEKLCQKVRSKRNLSTVPLIALVSDSSDAYVERLYNSGADDVIRVDEGAQLVSRLKALPAKELLVRSDRGMAVVADKDHARCDVFGRVLMNAGYDVKFALDDVALRYYTQQNRPALVVGNAELAPPRKLIEEARQRGCDAVWIVTSSRRDLGKHAEDLLGLERVTVVATSAPPESVLFTSNELLRGEAPPSRSGERALYGTVVAFREAGGEADDMGFSYNISAGGVYVRTLAPPEANEVWVDLRPPRCKQRVRLEGRVAWRRFYDPGSAADVPPGFGVSFTAGLGKSLDLWRKHATTFVNSCRTGPQAVAAMVREALRASSPELDPSSDSHIAAVSIRPTAIAAEVTAKGADPAARPVTKRAQPAAAAVDKKPAAPVAEPAPPVAEPTPALAEPAAPVAEPTPALAEPAAPVAEPTPALAEPTPALPEPHATESVAKGAPSTRRTFWLAALLGVVLVGGGGAAFVLGLGPFASKPTSTNPAAPVAVRPVAAVSASTAPPASATGPSAGAVASVGAAEERDGAVAPVEAGADASGAPPLDEDGGDGHDLAANLGLLAVRSSVAADVYATGFKLGATNEKHQIQCGLKFVRLGKGEPPTWLTAGRTVDVKCQALTVVELEPK